MNLVTSNPEQQPPPASGEGVPIGCPYPGFSAFTSNDAEHFFGRQNDIAAIRSICKSRPSGLIILVGQSGVGKTSLLQAGLLSQTSSIASIRPLKITTSASPRKLLARIRCALGLPEQDAEDSAHLIHRDLDACADHSESWLHIDGLENVLASDEGNFWSRPGSLLPSLTLLAELAAHRRIHLLASLAGHYRTPLIEVVQSAPELDGVCILELGPIRGAEVEEAISRSAIDKGSKFDPVLLRRLSQLVDDAPETLPLVNQTLRHLWLRGSRKNPELGEKQFLAEGGLGRAISVAFEPITADEETVGKLVQLVFPNRLPNPDPDTSNQPQPRAVEVSRIQHDPQLSSLARSLVARRLFTVEGNSPQTAAIRPVCPLVMEAWPAAREWIADNQESKVSKNSGGLLVPLTLGLLCAAAAISLILPKSDSTTSRSTMGGPSFPLPAGASDEIQSQIPQELPSSRIAKLASTKSDSPLAPPPVPLPTTSIQTGLSAQDQIVVDPGPVLASNRAATGPVEQVSSQDLSDLLALPAPSDAVTPTEPPRLPEPDLDALRQLLSTEASLADDRLAARIVGQSLPPASAESPTSAEFAPLLAHLIHRIGIEPENTAVRDELATILVEVGAVAQGRGNVSTALDNYKSALLTGALPPAGMAVRLGLILDEQGDSSASDCAFEFAGRVLHQIDGQGQNHEVSASWVLPVPAYLARAFLNSSKPDAALEIYRYQGNPATVGRSIALWMKGNEQGALSVFRESSFSTTWGNANSDWMGAPALVLQQLKIAAKASASTL